MSEEEALIEEASRQASELAIDLMTVVAIHSGRTGISVVATTQALAVLLGATLQLLERSAGADMARMREMINKASVFCDEHPDYIDVVGSLAFENAKRMRSGRAH